MGIGDWGLGIGPIPNPQSPIPNPQFIIKIFNFLDVFCYNKINYKINYNKIKNYCIYNNYNL